MASPWLPAPWRVVSRREETHDVVTLELEPDEIGPPSPWEPGQFSMLWAFGAGEVPISISGGCAESGRILHTIRSVGSVTRALCALTPGEFAGWRGPYGHGWPLAEARGRDLLVVAGGIGLAPLRPVLEAVAAQRSEYGRVALLFGTRHPEDLLFEGELERWRREASVDVRVTVDHATPSWTGDVGVVTTLIPAAAVDPRAAVAFVCGPEVMMRYAVDFLEAEGLRTDRIWLSLERNMECGIGLCGHCQLGDLILCRDGPVFRLDRVEHVFEKAEL